MALVASTAEAMKPPEADEHVQFLQAQFRKLLLALGRAESERRITNLNYGSQHKWEKSSGRFMIDLGGKDCHLFLSLIAVGEQKKIFAGGSTPGGSTSSANEIFAP